MAKMLKYLLLLVFVLSESQAEETTQELYENRIKLLTGSTTPPSCNKDKDDFSECLKGIIRIVRSHIIDGIPELNIPSIEPLQLNSTTFHFKVGVASGRLLMKNAEIHGISSENTKNIDLKVENGVIKFNSESFIPKLQIIGDYKAVVTLNNRFNFKPQGTFNLTVYDLNIKTMSEGTLIEKDGHQFLQLNKIDAEPKIGDMDIDVTGIFDDPELNEFALNVGKQYWREVYRIMLPETRDYWAPLIMRLFNESLGLIPFDAFIKDE